MKTLLVFLLCFLCACPAFAIEESDAPERSVQDFIKDYVDVPEGAIDWKVFGQTKVNNIETKTPDGLDLQYYKPEFSKDIKDLDGKTVKIKGFIFPLTEADGQTLFLFGPFPMNCPFQYHVQPNLVLEVHAEDHPVTFTYDPVTITGTLKLIPEDTENSVFYRLNNARATK